MVGALRRHLRRIRYYSASPQRSTWHRAVDTALFTTFFLAFIAALLCNQLIDRAVLVGEYEGRLNADENRQVEATIATDDRPPRWTGTPVGEFEMQVVDQFGGWPLTTWTREQRPTFEIHTFADGVRAEGDLDAIEAQGVDPQAIGAISRALRQMPGAYHRRDATVERQWMRWLINAGMWWVMLYVFAILFMLPARIVIAVWRNHTLLREQDMRRRGICPGCGYDLRGLEFHDRCPECGKLMT